MTTELTLHKAYDAMFDELCELMEDGFSADLLEPADWDARFAGMPFILKGFNPGLVQGAAIMKYLHVKLFFAEHAQDWIIPANAAKYVELFGRALDDGYLLDCVVATGPTPKIPWEAKITSPKKAAPKKSPAPRVDPQIPPGSSPQVAIVQGPPLQNLVQSSNVQALPSVLIPEFHLPAVHQVAASPPPLFPPGSSVDNALLSFLANGGGPSLPLSTVNSGTSLLSLPPLSSGASSCHSFIPTSQPIYDLGKYLRSYVPEDSASTLMLDASGNLVARKSVRKISSAAEWNEAMLNFAVALSESPSEAQTFTWAAFTVYLSRVALYFRLYTFPSVIAFDVAFRKWRRAHCLPWDASNGLINDLILTQTSAAPIIPAAKPARDNSCGDFQNGKCKRPACVYPHRCRRCNTTFASSFRACPCVGGILPPGVTLPSGVTFGV